MTGVILFSNVGRERVHNIISIAVIFVFNKWNISYKVAMITHDECGGRGRFRGLPRVLSHAEVGNTKELAAIPPLTVIDVVTWQRHLHNVAIENETESCVENEW